MIVKPYPVLFSNDIMCKIARYAERWVRERLHAHRLQSVEQALLMADL